MKQAAATVSWCNRWLSVMQEACLRLLILFKRAYTSKRWKGPQAFTEHVCQGCQHKLLIFCTGTLWGACTIPSCEQPPAGPGCCTPSSLGISSGSGGGGGGGCGGGGNGSMLLHHQNHCCCCCIAAHCCHPAVGPPAVAPAPRLAAAAAGAGLTEGG